MSDDTNPAPTPDLLTSLVCTALTRIGTRMATGFDQYFSALGVTQAQFRILLAVCERGAEGVAPSTLADTLLIERATVSALTARMVESGWLERRPGPNRRTFRLTPTPEGQRLLDAAVPRAIALADLTLAELSREQLEGLHAQLGAIEARLRDPRSRLPMTSDAEVR